MAAKIPSVSGQGKRRFTHMRRSEATCDGRHLVGPRVPHVRAVAYERYGGPDVLRIEDVPEPSAGPAQVLVRVSATSLNLSDWECLVGA